MKTFFRKLQEEIFRYNRRKEFYTAFSENYFNKTNSNYYQK